MGPTRNYTYGAIAAVQEKLTKNDLEQTECGKYAKNELFVQFIHFGQVVLMIQWFL